jgi:hypothetical protein
MNAPVRSGNGWRMTLPESGEPVVSVWAQRAEDAEHEAHKSNIRHFQAMSEEETRRAREQARLAAEFARQAVAAFRKIRARA